MELWIKSQNKETLAKVTDLFVEEGKSFRDIYDGYDISNNTYRFGRYKTEKRALEVLNEISKLVEKVVYHTQVSNEVIFYQMPEEKDNASSK